MNKGVLLVVSYAGVRAINRAVYSLLRPRFDVALAVPRMIVATSGLEVSLEPRLDGEGQMVGHIVTGRNPRIFTFLGIKQTLNRIQPQTILYEGDPASRLAWQLANWSRRNGAKFICQTYDNLDRSWSSSSGKTWKVRLVNLAINSLSKMMIRRVYALLVINRAGESVFANLGYRRITRIPLGYNPQVFFFNEEMRQATRRRMAIKQDEVIVGYFGRMVRQKGVHLLIKAMAELQELDWRLLLDDNFDPNDEYADEIRSLILQYRLQHRVVYFSASHTDIADYMRAADISVAPSLTTPAFTEQYGRAVQEAMACGCTVIVSDSGHLPDLVGDSELVFPESDLRKLVELLRKAVSDRTWRHAKSCRLKSRASEALTIDRQAEMVSQVVGELC